MSTETPVKNVKPAQTLDVFRVLKAAIFSGNDVAAPAKYIGFGKGGHTADNKAREFDSTREALFDQVLVVEVDSVSQPDMYKLRAIGSTDGAGLPVVSEAMLYDAQMRPMCMATFPPKFTDVGETYGVTLLMHF